MKAFSKAWIKSKLPKKQRKYRIKAPLHIKRKMMASHLSKDLKEKYKKRSFPICVGDRVKILRGEFKGKIGKIEEVNTTKMKVFIEGVERSKGEGQAASKYPIDPSNLKVIELNLKDAKRKKALERK